jgi:hypothetical protein
MDMRKSMPWSEPPAVLRYGAAIAVVAAAVAAGSLLEHVVKIAPVVSLLLCGVLFAAWFGGLGKAADVRCWAQSRHVLLGLSLSGFGPGGDISASEFLRRKLTTGPHLARRKALL